MKQNIRQRHEIHRACVMLDSKHLNIGVKYPVRTKAKKAVLDVLGGLAIGAFVFVVCTAMAVIA